MNDIELRERFNEWAAPLRAAPPAQIAVIRSRARRRLTGIAAAAGSALAITAAVTGLAVTTLAAPALVRSPTGWGTGKYPAPPGQPYVFVNQSATAPPEIRNVATGRVVSPLRPLDHGGFFTFVAVTSNDRLFVLGQQDKAGNLTFAAARIDRFGAVHFRRVLPRVSIPHAVIEGITVNPAGTRLAVNTLPPGGIPSGTTLRLYNLNSGAPMGSWHEPGLVDLLYWQSNAALVVDFEVQPARSAHEVRVLPVTTAFAPGARLSNVTRPGPDLRGYSDGQVTSDGSIVLVPTQTGQTQTVQEYSAATGRLLRTIPIGSVRASGPYFCGVLWASPTGRDLLTQCGTRQLAVSNGRARPIGLPWRFLGQQDGAIETFAW